MWKGDGGPENHLEKNREVTSDKSVKAPSANASKMYLDLPDSFKSTGPIRS